MVKCDFPGCKEVIEYLPFKCKYCGGTYCKSHRLPENHECTFEMRAPTQKKYSSTTVPTPNPEKESKLYSSTIPDEYNDEQLEEEMKQFIERQERIAKEKSRTENRYQRRIRRQSSGRSLISHSTTTKVTYWIMGLNLVFYILGVIYPKYIQLQIYFFLQHYQFQTILTAMFAPGSIISLIFSLLILYWTGRMIEYQLGPKFFLLLYFILGIMGGIAGLLIQYLFQIGSAGFFVNGFFRSPYGFMFFTSQNAVFTGLIVFICYTIGLEREMRFYLFFIPIRMKAKHIIYFMVILSLLWGFLVPDAGQLASLIAIPVAKRMYDKVSSRTINTSRGFF